MYWRNALAAISVAALLQALTEAYPTSSSRLPRTAKPINYKLHLEPNLASSTITGHVVVTIVVTEATNAIVLNANEVRIIELPNLSGQTASKVTYNRDMQTATISFNKTIQPGIWELGVKFTAKINTALSGVFRVNAPAVSGSGTQPETYVLTHFEPTDARKAFPCWDEPALKATFDVTIVAPASKKVLSNTPVKQRKPLTSRPDMVEVRFARTPKMSTYLVSFVIGQFDSVETVDSNGVRIAVHTPMGRKDEGLFALDIANKTLSHFTKLFGLGYPLPKMDLVSLPDFPSVAMENWGLVLVHEPSLLVSRETARSQRTFVATTVIHELAHQWFGNLVTPSWWSDLWLNEGFATWISFLTTDDIAPEFKTWHLFLRTEKLSSMNDDALKASHSIEAEVKRPEDVAEVFDSISYGKGASVISMLHDWLGHERFFSGLHLYLSRFSYSNAATQDLWLTMQESTGEPVVDVMRDWTEHKGFPMISARIERDDELGVCFLQLTQMRYRLPGDDLPRDERSPDNRLWRVPVTVATEDGTIIRRVMSGRRMSVELPTCGWAMLNPRAEGYYRTKYETDLMRDLVEEAAAGDAGGIGPAGRLTLIDDAFAMHAADLSWAEDPLRVVHALRHDSSLEVWTDMLNHLYSLGAAVQSGGSGGGARTGANWRGFLHRLCSEKLEKFGGLNATPGDPPDAGDWRSRLMTCLDFAEASRVARWSRRHFASWLNGSGTVPSDVWDIVCEISAAEGGAADFHQLLLSLNHSAPVDQRVRILGCLGGFSGHSVELDRRLMHLALGNELTSTEALTLIEGMSSRMVWKLLTSHWTELARRFQGPYMLKNLVSRVNFDTVEDAIAIRRFFRHHKALGVRNAAKKKVEQMLHQAERINKDRVEMRYLINNVLAYDD